MAVAACQRKVIMLALVRSWVKVGDTGDWDKVQTGNVDAGLGRESKWRIMADQALTGQRMA